jgi:hypothetical protein
VAKKDRPARYSAPADESTKTQARHQARVFSNSFMKSTSACTPSTGIAL